MSTAKISPSAAAISATLKHLSVRPPPYRNFLTSLIPAPGIGRRPRKLAVTICSKASETLEVCAKESLTTPNKLGDCELIYSPNHTFIFSYLIDCVAAGEVISLNSHMVFDDMPMRENVCYIVDT